MAPSSAASELRKPENWGTGILIIKFKGTLDKKRVIETVPAPSSARLRTSQTLTHDNQDPSETP